MKLIIRLGHGNMQIPTLTASLSLGMNCEFIIGHIKAVAFGIAGKGNLR